MGSLFFTLRANLEKKQTMTAAATVKNNIRPLVTPDGVPLNLELASYGERASALLIDLLIMSVTFGAILLGGFFLMSGATWDFLVVVIIMAFFAIRSFYFIFFEIRWHGVTPGKKAIGLRVIDRKGGVLEPEGIFARNLMREVELYLPLTLFFIQADIGLEKVYLLLNFLWLGIFVLLPLFNKDRLRAGDMIGGTLVIRSPKVQLLSDPVNKSLGVAGKEERPGLDVKYTFTVQQLEVYGIFELQTLETVLRSKGRDKEEILVSVASKIANKINWQNGNLDYDHEQFLSDFYTAMRKHHEGQLLFGKRKKDKFDLQKNPHPKSKKQPRK